MTLEFERFEARARRLVYLTFPLRYFKEHQEELKSPLQDLRAKGIPWFPDTVQGLAIDLVGFTACLDNAMLWTFYDEYNRAVHSGRAGEPHDGTKTIIQGLPQFTVRCHMSHARVHVLQTIEDLRNRFIHAHIKDYTHLTCNLPPEQLLLRPMEILGESAGRRVFALDDVLSDPLTQQERSTAMVETHRTRSLTFGELLEETLLECIEAYDLQVESRRGSSFLVPES